MQHTPVLPLRTFRADSHGHWVIEDDEACNFVLLEFEEEMDEDEQGRRATQLVNACNQLALADKVIQAAREAHIKHEYMSAISSDHSEKIAAKVRFFQSLKALALAIAEYDKERAAP